MNKTATARQEQVNAFAEQVYPRVQRYLSVCLAGRADWHTQEDARQEAILWVMHFATRYLNRGRKLEDWAGMIIAWAARRVLRGSSCTGRRLRSDPCYRGPRTCKTPMAINVHRLAALRTRRPRAPRRAIADSTPASLAALSVDLATWSATLTATELSLLTGCLAGERVNELSLRLHQSFCQVKEARRALRESWHSFQGEEVGHDATA